MPELSQGLEMFANWQTVLLCLTVFAVAKFVRSIVENAPKLARFAQGWVWKTVIVPILPVALGITLALFCKKYPWPMPVADVFSAKMMYGLGCGLVSDWMVLRVEAWFGVVASSPMVARLRQKPVLTSQEVPTLPPPPKVPKL